jgi:hypothetical protein
VAARGPSRADGLMRDVASANVSDTTLTWTQANSSTVSVVTLK